MLKRILDIEIGLEWFEFFQHSVWLLVPFGLAITVMLALMTRWWVLLWAATPPLVLYAFHNWELPVVATAVSAVAVDGSGPALELAQQGAEASGHAAAFTTRQGDAFAELEAMAQEGARFDIVICDPPAFAPSKQALEAGLRAYERIARMAAGLVADGGILCVCSCSHAADLTRFRNASARGIGKGGRRAQLIHTGFAGADHPLLPQLAESGYLKSLVFRMTA